jgi:hypothetical protein
MQTKAKSNSVVTHALGEDGHVIAFKVLNAGEFQFDVRKVHPNMLRRAALHGFVQRIADAAAKSRDTETGKPASSTDKLAAMQRVAGHYETGVDQWALVRAEGGGVGPSIVVRAFAALQGMPVADAQARIKELAEKRRLTTKAVLAQLRKTDTIRAKIAELEAAEPAGEEGEDLLAELMGEQAGEDEEGNEGESDE